MRMVRELCLLTNADAKAKAASLQTTQQRFLDNMDSCISWEVTALKLVDKATQTSLRQLIMAIPNPDGPKQRLFHSRNKMYCNNGYIFQFKPTKSQSAREIMAGLLVVVAQAQLQQAKETTGLGWLLFSTNKFDKEVLKSQIWETTGGAGGHKILGS